MRPRSGEGEAKLEKQHKKYIENIWKMLIFLLFSCRQALQQKCIQNDVPEALRDPPGDPLGASGDTLGGPRGAQSDPRRPQEPPRAPQEARPKDTNSALEAGSAPKGRPEAFGEPFWSQFGLTLDPPEVDFRASGGSFSSVRGAFLESRVELWADTFASDPGGSSREQLQKIQRCSPLQPAERARAARVREPRRDCTVSPACG